VTARAARILLLAGTAEARALAGRLWDMPRLHVVASLAGVTRHAPRLAVAETRVGGYGGAEGLARFLAETGIDAVVDATHPFAARMPWNVRAACREAGVPRLRLIRPAWEWRAGWQRAADLAAAAPLPPPGARVLLTTGKGGIAPFAAREDLTIVARSIEDAGPLPDHITPVEARPPFTYAAEFTLMCSYRITHLVTKNAGGAGHAKLDAADALGITTVMIDRPMQPPGGASAATVPEAVAWLRRTVGI
jgi:precorrin-6A/cobalt-precorrin-6A reductase